MPQTGHPELVNTFDLYLSVILACICIIGITITPQRDTIKIN